MQVQFKNLSLERAQLKFASDGARSFTGYASVFGTVDDVGDVILPGAFSEVLAQGDTFKMYFNHGWLKGELPIGKMRVKQDEYGLRVVGAEFTDGIKQADEVALAVKHGTIDGLSVAIAADAEGVKRRSDGKGYEWSRIKRMREISVVAEPANDPARIDSVKAALDEAQSLKEIEALLREAGGFSRADACSLVARIKSLSQREADDESQAEAKELLQVIRGAVFIPKV